MTFAADFIFYSDGRPSGQDLPDDDIALRAELAEELARRVGLYPGRIAKGRMTRAEADRELRVWRVIAEGCRAVPAATPRIEATGVEQLHALRREIALRRHFYPGWVTSGRMTQPDANRRLLLIEQWHDAYWYLKLWIDKYRKGEDVDAAQVAAGECARWRRLAA